MIYVITEGEYSDYGILGIYKGPPNIDKDALTEEWRRIYAEKQPLPGIFCSMTMVVNQWMKENPEFETVEWDGIWVDY